MSSAPRFSSLTLSLSNLETMGKACCAIIGPTTRVDTFVALYTYLHLLPTHEVPSKDSHPEVSILRMSGIRTIPIVLSSLSDQQTLETEQPKIDVYARPWICVVEIFEGHIRKVIPIFLQGDWTFEEKHVLWRGHPNLESVLASMASNLQVCFVCMRMQSAYNFYFLHIDRADFHPLRSPGLDAKMSTSSAFGAVSEQSLDSMESILPASGFL